MEFKVTTVNLDRPRRMKLTIGGLNAFQEAAGFDMLGVDLQYLSPKEMMLLLWACLQWDDKTLKPDDITALIEKIDARELMTALLACIENSLPEVKPDAAVPLAENQSTGSGSGPSQSITSTLPRTLT